MKAIESDSQVILPQQSSCAHPYNWDWSIEHETWENKWINNKGELEIENYYCCCGNRIGVRGECQAYVNKFLFLNTIDILKWIYFLHLPNVYQLSRGNKLKPSQSAERRTLQPLFIALSVSLTLTLISHSTSSHVVFFPPVSIFF